MEKTTTINNDFRDRIGWGDECYDFVDYGNMALFCEGNLSMIDRHPQAAETARWAEQELCKTSGAVAEHMEGLLYIDSLEPRQHVISLNGHKACSFTLRTSTDKVIRATDVKALQSVSGSMKMFSWWKARVKEIKNHHSRDYEREVKQASDLSEMSRRDVLDFTLAAVDDALRANPWGGLFFKHKDHLPTLVKSIHALSGSHQGNELDELIDLVAQREWIVEEKNAEAEGCKKEGDPLPSGVGLPGGLTAFEVCIPDYLRKKGLLQAWEKLVDAGYLTPDKKLAKTTKKVTAQYIIRCFCANRENNEWSHFEKLWEIRNLKANLGEPKKADKEKIDKIFAFCN